MGIKGCWTCRARKVRCDLRKPTCTNCAKALQPCKGYGMQLSWPREGNKRRALVNRDTAGLAKLSQQYRGRGVMFLNAFTSDVALADALQENRELAHYLHTLRVPHLPILSQSLLWEDYQLFDYFKETKTRILAPVIDESLAHFIMRMAISNDGSSVNPVMEGIFALSSLLLLGPSKSQSHKSRLISMLQKNVTRMDREGVLQNLIATMLLYQCEVCNTAEPGGLWRFYLCGAKKIISAASEFVALYQHDCAVLMDWIYYHEVMSEFSLHHWAELSTVDGFCKGPLAIRPTNIIIDDPIAANRITCPMDVLHLVRNVCKRPSTYASADLPYNNTDMERLQQFRQNIYGIIGEYGTFHEHLESLLNRQDMLSCLYQYAALIYLNRTVSNVSTSSFSHRRLVREGILLLKNLGFCESAWPLFIIACEANEDSQRLQILSILADTNQEIEHRSNHIPLMQQMIEAIWNQNDLAIENYVGYSKILDAVVSTAPSLPLFA
ncbi:hypothetical protein M431DRAFT_144107 [Trichoderma harzianum CBS 226.95]|uniref:Zn(2)-C6 fungal-type domain-containing protein n=1 Tax=Trichoderma harzianum CBS 226.95 TaxID=983964 RepID=A0A2T4A923_TRIHA|nr:hypothetical protein M431DRAFT_144107 [Trichoderma harzianum CBS 226.95]PTB53579.1 hypothetical protein M431DRAFT_144107 [Trichoderma harzianum CBS 226.95]